MTARQGTAGVYQIKNLRNGKAYIGSSSNIEARWRTHRSSLNKGKHHSAALQRAWEKYGQEAFEFTILEVVECQKRRLVVETEFIASTRSADGRHGYNCLAVGGSPVGHKHTEESRRRMSEGQRKIPKAVRLTYCISFAGRRHTEEAKAKISLSSSMRRLTEEQKKRVGDAHRGKSISSEHKAISAATCRARNSTPEHRAKVSAALKGRELTPEWKAKLSASAKAHHAKKREAPPT